VEVNFIEVDALVVDDHGNFVKDLTLEDFEILEDGVPQEIATFRYIDMPVTRVTAPVKEMPSIVSDVGTNEAPEESRIYVLVLDDLHTAGQRSGLVRQVARDFIENWMAEGDWVAVTNTSGNAEASHDFTDNRRILLETIDKFNGEKLRPITMEQLEVLKQIQAELDPDLAIMQMEAVYEEHAYRARAALDHLRAVSRMLGNIEGRRKALVYVSEGMAYDIQDYMSSTTATEVFKDVEAAVGEAGLHNVSFYTLDVRGLGAGSGEGVMFSQSPAALAQDETVMSAIGDLGSYALNTEVERLLETASRGVEASIQEEVQRSQDSLRILSDQTGGIAVVNKNDLGEGLQQIVEDNSRYYLLGYYPDHDLTDGKYRQIEVRVKRPDVKVRTRKGYISSKTTATEAGASDALSEVLNSTLPTPGIPLRVFAAPIGLNKEKATVPVVLESSIDGFHFTENDGKLNDRVEMSVWVLNNKGEVVDEQTRAYDLIIRPEIRDLMLEDGFRSMLVLDLPPGSYRLRIGVHETGAARTGSIHYDLDVPETSDDEAVMSGVFLTSRRDSQIPLAAREEEKKRVPVIPSTRRRFTPDDELLAYAEAVEAREESAQTGLTIQALIRNAGGEVVAQFSESDITKYPSPGRLVGEARIDLSTLQPGNYTLELQTLDRNGSLRTKQSTLFSTAAVRKAMDPITYGLGSYQDLVTTYRDGESEAAREQLAEWPIDMAESAVDELIKTEPDAQTLMTAALLHTELILYPKEEMRELTIEGQIELGKKLIDSVPDESLRRSFLRDWFLALAYHFQGTNLSLSRDHLRRGAELFEDDAQFLLALGATHECIAELHDNSVSFVDAEEVYLAALEIDPNLEEAHLRLGVVLSSYGLDYEQEALRELKWIIEHSQESYLLYLAHLTIGQIYESQGNWEGAAEAYRSAVEAQPDWVNAYRLLYRVLYNLGNLEGARQVESSMPANTEDVYSIYYLGLAQRLPGMLRQLRQQVPAQ
jgi:VWFA-related protein